MIKRIEIKNIESHERTIVDLANSNAIIGSSGTGKSAFLRAISFLLFYDQTIGRYDEENASVLVVCEDGKSISRERVDTISYVCAQCGYKENEQYPICPSCHSRFIEVKRTKKTDKYKLNGIPFEKMGRGFANLSSDIKKDYPVPFIELNDGKFIFPGFHTQFEGFIFTHLSGADMNKLFSILEGHDFVEELTKVVRGDARKTNNEIETRKKDLETSKVKLRQEKVDLLQEKANLTALTDRYQNACSLHNDLVLLDIEYNKYVSLFEKIEKIRTFQSEVKVIEIGNLVSLHEEYKELTPIWIKFKQLLVDTKRLKTDIGDLKTKNLARLELAYGEYVNLQKAQQTYIKVATARNLAKQNFDDSETDKSEFDKLIKQEFLDKNLCPFSGYPISTTCKKRILNG